MHTNSGYIGRRYISTKLSKRVHLGLEEHTDAPDAQPASEGPWGEQHTSPFVGSESEPCSACGAGTQFRLFLLQRRTLWQGK